jgi:hypothetical protein
VQAGGLACIGAERKAGADSADVLGLTLKFEPEPQITEALDASIALIFEIKLDTQNGSRSQRAVLSHDSLLERYDLAFAGRTRHFRLRAELLDAFANTLTFSEADIRRVRVRLLLGELPAPLRMPALLDPDWHLDTGWCVMQYAPTSAAQTESSDSAP